MNWCYRSWLAGSLSLSGIRSQLTPAILLLEPRSVRNRQKNFPCSPFSSTCYAWTNIVYIVSEKNSYKCVMFRNVIVQYKCTVTNSFKQDRASPASVWKYYVITNGSSYQPPHSPTCRGTTWSGYSTSATRSFLHQNRAFFLFGNFPMYIEQNSIAFVLTWDVKCWKTKYCQSVGRKVLNS